MPLLIISGRPSSGKSTIAERLAAYFKEHGKNVELIRDEDNVNFCRSIYSDFKKEKAIRSALRSSLQRLLDKNTIVICDSLNHIKGYRYELFCLAKNCQTRYAVVYCNAPLNVCKWLNAQKSDENSRYSDEILCALSRRYEQPDPKNRWDSPLFTLQIGGHKEDGELLILNEELKFGEEAGEIEEREEKMRRIGIGKMDEMKDEEEEFLPNDECKLPKQIPLPLEDLYACLVEGKELTANLCTKPKTGAQISLHELDCKTQEIVNKLLAAQRTATFGQKLIVLDLDGEKDENKVNFTKPRTLPQLNRIRQQFITYIRTHPIDNLDSIGSLFVNFLNSTP